jgi:hypothetical protein
MMAGIIQGLMPGGRRRRLVAPSLPLRPVPLAGVVIMLAALLSAPPARAQEPAGSAQCEAAIAVAEQAEALPAGLLGAIARVETGRLDAASGRTRPWPWSIDAGGVDSIFETKAAAIAAVQALQARSVRSIDVGCLQVNLMYHPMAFASLDEAFEPASNVAYAARLLHILFAETLNWASAAAAYHSRIPELGLAYQQRVLATWGGSFPLRWQAPAPALLPLGPIPPLHPFAPPPLVANGLTPPASLLPLTPAWLRQRVWVSQ